MTEVEPTIVTAGPSGAEGPVGESLSAKGEPAQNSVPVVGARAAAMIQEPPLELEQTAVRRTQISSSDGSDENATTTVLESVESYPSEAGESTPDDSPAADSEATTSPGQPVNVVAMASAPKSLRSIIEAYLIALEGHHRHVLDSGAAEAIHKMRVVTRKLQAAIDLLEFKPDELKIRDIKKRLRRWRRSLSRIRNYDVFLTIVERETLARRPGGRRPYELIGAEVEKRRVKNLRKARSVLEHIKIGELAARLGFEVKQNPERCAGELEAQPSGAYQPSTGAALLFNDEPRIAARAFDRLRQRLAEFQAKALSTHATDNPSEIHELRIAAKRLRYLIEALSQMGYGDSTRAVDWLKTTQDRLGDLNDIEAFGDEVVRIAARPRFVRKHMSEAGEILQAASRFLAKRDGMRARLLPVRVPQVLGAASSRLTRSISGGPVSRDGD